MSLLDLSSVGPLGKMVLRVFVLVFEFEFEF